MWLFLLCLILCSLCVPRFTQEGKNQLFSRQNKSLFQQECRNSRKKASLMKLLKKLLRLLILVKSLGFFLLFQNSNIFSSSEAMIPSVSISYSGIRDQIWTYLHINITNSWHITVIHQCGRSSEAVHKGCS